MNFPNMQGGGNFVDFRGNGYIMNASREVNKGNYWNWNSCIMKIISFATHLFCIPFYLNILSWGGIFFESSNHSCANVRIWGMVGYRVGIIIAVLHLHLFYLLKRGVGLGLIINCLLEVFCGLCRDRVGQGHCTCLSWFSYRWSLGLGGSNLLMHWYREVDQKVLNIDGLSGLGNSWDAGQTWVWGHGSISCKSSLFHSRDHMVWAGSWYSYRSTRLLGVRGADKSKQTLNWADIRYGHLFASVGQPSRVLLHAWTCLKCLLHREGNQGNELPKSWFMYLLWFGLETGNSLAVLILCSVRFGLPYATLGLHVVSHWVHFYAFDDNIWLSIVHRWRWLWVPVWLPLFLLLWVYDWNDLGQLAGADSSRPGLPVFWIGRMSENAAGVLGLHMGGSLSYVPVNGSGDIMETQAGLYTLLTLTVSLADGSLPIVMKMGILFLTDTWCLLFENSSS
ncbi:hypothetical protein E3N88_22709 [Mikania micrantha]|uniref:Uncharacterized protein n=1 Tax=Mikania micrantha TaxID=192012 RepID=A0A5N6NDR2_9ASTR|nr:hypothetical protein E3N88_22709 [Mikania micrantha]